MDARLALANGCRELGLCPCVRVSVSPCEGMRGRGGVMRVGTTAIDLFEFWRQMKFASAREGRTVVVHWRDWACMKDHKSGLWGDSALMDLRLDIEGTVWNDRNH